MTICFDRHIFYPFWLSFCCNTYRIIAKKGKNHSISKQTVKFTTKSQIFFIYILNYNQELGKMTLLIKF